MESRQPSGIWIQLLSRPKFLHSAQSQPLQFATSGSAIFEPHVTLNPVPSHDSHYLLFIVIFINHYYSFLLFFNRRKLHLPTSLLFANTRISLSRYKLRRNIWYLLLTIGSLHLHSQAPSSLLLLALFLKLILIFLRLLPDYYFSLVTVLAASVSIEPPLLTDPQKRLRVSHLKFARVGKSAKEPKEPSFCFTGPPSQSCGS